MNLRELIASTRRVQTNMWHPEKDYRSRGFGPILDLNIKGQYNAHYKTLTVTLYIKSSSQYRRSISKAAGDTIISTHTASITFKNIVEHYVDVQQKVAEYNAITPNEPITSVQDIIYKMQESEPTLVPVEVDEDHILFRTKIDLTTECRVKCTCAHFYYTFAYYCAQAGAYIGDAVAPFKARRKLKGKVNFRNRTGVPGLCKHLQLLISLILKTDNGINGNMEYANVVIPTPANIRNAFSLARTSNAQKVVEAYENDEDSFIALNRDRFRRIAQREARQFNAAVRQEKSENYDLSDYSEMDDE